MTERELVTLTAALLAGRRRDWFPETAAAEALRLWYFVGGNSARDPSESPRRPRRTTCAMRSKC